MKLILSLDGVVIQEIELRADRFRIGRGSDNDIQIESPAISRQHAVITRVLDDVFLEDLESTNGTYVNGRAVHRHALRPDDLIELGQYRLRYVTETGG